MAVGTLALVTVSLGACSRSPRAAGVRPTTIPTDSAGSGGVPATTKVAVGRVYVAGSEPGTVVTIRPDTGSALKLVGDLASELRRLSGAYVEVRGESTTGPADGIAVGDYAVLSIDGRRPLVGLLTTSGGTLWLIGHDSLALADPHGQLSRLVGAKVWVLADTTMRIAVVQSYGVIRDPAQ